MTALIGQRKPLASLIAETGGRAVVLALSRDPHGKVTVLLFGPGDGQPRYVAKVPGSEPAARSVQAEAARLDGLDRRALGDLARTIPSVVSIAEHLGRPVLVTTGLPGRVMLSSYHTWRHTARRSLVRADFDAAGEWLAELHRRSHGEPCDLAVMLAGTAEAISRRFGADEEAAALITRLAALRERLSGFQVPRTLVHGDFWPGNLLISDRRVRGVVDWENASQAGLPVHDLARFALTYSLYLTRHTGAGRRVPGHPGLRAGSWDAGLRYALDGNGWYPALVTGFVTDGLRRLGIPGDLTRDVLLAELARMSAEADEPEFARQHLLACLRLCQTDLP